MDISRQDRLMTNTNLPYSFPLSTHDMDMLTLACWVRSQDAGRVFEVEISSTRTVAALKEAIKNKKSVAFRDTDADTLHLYKPKVPVSRPHEENLGGFILSEHGELLKTGVAKLSEVFPESPPEGNIHIVVDWSWLTIDCWLRDASLDTRSQVSIQASATMTQLKQAIKEIQSSLRAVDNGHIHLFRVSGDDDELEEILGKPGDGQPLQGSTLAPNFLGVPVLDPLLVVVEGPAAGGGTPTPVQQQPISPSDALLEYQDIFLQTKNWGKLEHSDIERNQIVAAGDMPIPGFVTAFEQKLVRKPCLPLDVPGLQTSGMFAEYFEPSTGNESQEEIRHASQSEVIHTTHHIAFYDWQKYWDTDWVYRRPLDENAMCSIFFDPLLITEHRTATAWIDKSWPITVVVKCEGEEETRKYRPRSGFLVSDSDLPRLLVEVNSGGQDDWPTDLIRMLMTGAFLVRFVNNFVRTFSQAKNFVLCAFFIWANGNVARFTLFQKQDDKKVYYNRQETSFNYPPSRVKFARHLYSLLSSALNQAQVRVVENAFRKFRNTVDARHMETFYTTHHRRKRRRTDDNDGDSAGREGGDGHTQLRAHGYEVKPKVIVDDSGGVWEPLYKTPDHILTVYQPTNPNEEFIAKKVREESNELEILRLLDTIPIKSNHVIPLIDSFDGWAILPKMDTVRSYVDFNSKPFESKVSQSCLGLITGLAYLHKHRIAHRDIKPDNLLVDKNLNLKIIDFDVAMQVEDEDEEVDDPCGTRGWIAPEVEKKLRHSPIRADRWACGQVVLFLLDTFGKEDKSLRAFARDLVAHNPELRPSLLEWDRYSAPSFWDAGHRENSDARNSSRLRRDRVEVDGENMSPPNMKKQRLGSGYSDMGSFRDRYGLGLDTVGCTDVPWSL